MNLIFIVLVGICPFVHTGNVVEKTMHDYAITRVTYEPFVDTSNVQKMKEWNMQDLERNLERHTITEECHIILYPEYALTSIEVRNDRNLALQFAQEIPELQTKPCELFDTSASQIIMRNLSCIAETYGVYLVLNLIEVETCSGEGCKEKLYSTTVAFNNTGHLLARIIEMLNSINNRYRKSHLYDETALDAFETEIVTFTTHTNITFGLLTAFDLMFEFPAFYMVNTWEVTEILVSFAWSGKLPFLTPHQIIAGWFESSTFAKEINLFVGCYAKPSLGYTGCEDHFAANGGHMYTTRSADCCKYGSPCSCSVSVISNVTAVPNKISPPTTTMVAPTTTTVAPTTTTMTRKAVDPKVHTAVDNNEQSIKTLPKTYIEDRHHENIDMRADELGLLTFSAYNNLENFTSINVPAVENIQQSIHLCYGDDFCCTLEYKFKSIPKNSIYQLIIYDGLWYHSNELEAWQVQVCAMVACLNEDLNTCANDNATYPINTEIESLKIHGIFHTSLVMPTTFDNIQPLRNIIFTKTKYDEKHLLISLELNTSSTSSGFKDLRTFGLHSHDFKYQSFNVNSQSTALLTGNKIYHMFIILIVSYMLL